MYSSRFYREGMGAGRFSPLVIQEAQSDIWIGLPPRIGLGPGGEAEAEAIAQFASKRLRELRAQIQERIREQPDFRLSLEPLPPDPLAPPLIRSMLDAASMAGVGPMASVAGAIAQELGRAILGEFELEELALENGGDIWLSLTRPLVLSIYAGISSLSGKIGVEVPPELCPLGICCSSGTVGPSLSFGKADACLASCADAALADAYATAFGNRLRSFDDIGPSLEAAKLEPNLLSLVLIRADRVGAVGRLKLCPCG